MCGYVDDVGYWGLADIVSSGKYVQSDGVALISAGRILFAVIRKKDVAVVNKEDGSVFHPRICNTESSFSYSDV